VVPGQDGVNESALGVNLGHKVCFTLVPKANSLVAPTTAAQVFYATLTVRALNGLSPAELVLGVSRTVAFLVPAAPM
jgi:hypothetical protein